MSLAFVSELAPLQASVDPARRRNAPLNYRIDRVSATILV
jgi:hypothetical protein